MLPNISFALKKDGCSGSVTDSAVVAHQAAQSRQQQQLVAAPGSSPALQVCSPVELNHGFVEAE